MAAPSAAILHFPHEGGPGAADGAVGGEGKPGRSEDNGAGAGQPGMGSSLPQVSATPPDTGLPLGLGLDTIPGFTMLMQENKDRLVFAKMTGAL